MHSLLLNIIPVNLLEAFCLQIDDMSKLAFDKLEDSELSIDSFSFYSSVSAVYSSKIEGEEIDLDSYIKHKRFGSHFQPDYTRKIDDLYDAYLFAQKTDLNQQTLEQAHAIITKNILQPSQQGKLRIGNMFVVTKEGKIEYVAATPDKVKSELQKLYDDIVILLSMNLKFKECLYFASMIHLVFIKIHPFEDGNGRTGRLMEKWFLSQKLGFKAWYIQSEKMYYHQQLEYFSTIRELGLEYDELDYSKALPFLLMLPKTFVQTT